MTAVASARLKREAVLVVGDEDLLDGGDVCRRAQVQLQVVCAGGLRHRLHTTLASQQPDIANFKSYL